MAKANNNPNNPGKHGNYSAYYMKGCDHLVFRAKGGPSSEMVKYSPVFATTRKYNAEFGASGMASGKIVRALYAIKHLGDPRLTGNLTSLSNTIKELDTINPLGKRAILFSKYPHLLDGFNLNKDQAFDSVIKNQIISNISRQDLSATVTLPDLIPKINFVMPWNYPLYRIIMVFGIIPDIIKNKQGYGPANKQTRYYPVQLQTEWAPAGAVRKGEDFVLQLSPDSNFDDTNSLILSIGIEAGKYITDSIIEPVKDLGCGKILAHV